MRSMRICPFFWFYRWRPWCLGGWSNFSSSQNWEVLTLEFKPWWISLKAYALPSICRCWCLMEENGSNCAQIAPDRKVTNLSWFTWDCPGFKTKSSASQHLPLVLTKRDGWSLLDFLPAVVKIQIVFEWRGDPGVLFLQDGMCMVIPQSGSASTLWGSPAVF